MSWPLTPKSHNLISPLELTRMLEGFTSGGKEREGWGQEERREGERERDRERERERREIAKWRIKAISTILFNTAIPLLQAWPIQTPTCMQTQWKGITPVFGQLNYPHPNTYNSIIPCWIQCQVMYTKPGGKVHVYYLKGVANRVEPGTTSKFLALPRAN